MKSFKMIDLFCGIGGIRLGFQKAFKKEVENIFSNEKDKRACETYQANFKENPFGDITKIEESKLPSFDILGAGFPCQAFSIAGRKQGFEDTRGTLFFDVARIIKEKKPKVVFLENVKGLVSHDRGNTFKVILATLNELGYEVYYKVLNAKDFGLPQKRERIYMVCFNREKVPDHASFSFPKKSRKQFCVGDILESNVDVGYFVSEQYWNSLKKHKERHSLKGNGFGYQIINPEDIANTIVVGGMGRERNLVIDNTKPTGESERVFNKEKVRVMTPREWARLQGFPDSFKFPVPKTCAYKQLGNSVAVNVIEAIAKEIKKVLK